MRTPKKNLALLELIIVILFFALSAVVLTQVFVKAQAMGDTSQAKTLSLVAAQDLAERLKSSPWDAGAVLSARDGWVKEADGAYSANFGKDMLKTDSNPVFTARAAVTPEKLAGGIFYSIKIEIDRVFDGQNIISINTGSFVPDAGAQS